MSTIHSNYSSRTDRTQNRYQNDFSDRLMQLQEQQAALQAQSVFQTANAQSTQNTQQTQEVQQTESNAEGCTDGKDDGKVGFWEGLKSVVGGAIKGVVNGVKGMFTDENGKFSLFKTLKSAAMIGACFIPGVGPFIGAGLCAVGVVKGGIGLAKNISAASQATTDAEKKAALEGCGANGLTTALSAVGLKGSIGAIAKGAGIEGAASNSMRANIKAMAKGSEGSALKNLAANAKTSAGFAEGGVYRTAFETASGEAGGGISGAWSGTKAVAKEMGSGAIENMAAFKTAATDKIKNSKTGQRISKYSNKVQKHFKSNKPVDPEIHAEAQARTAHEQAIQEARIQEDLRIENEYTNPSGMSASERAEIAKQFAEKDIYGDAASEAKLTPDQKLAIGKEKFTAGKAKVNGYYTRAKAHWNAGKTGTFTGAGRMRTVATNIGSYVTQDGADQANLNTAYAQMNSAYANYSGGSSTINFQQGGYTLLTPEEIDAKFAAINQNTINIRQAGIV